MEIEQATTRRCSSTDSLLLDDDDDAQIIFAADRKVNGKSSLAIVASQSSSQSDSISISTVTITTTIDTEGYATASSSSAPAATEFEATASNQSDQSPPSSSSPSPPLLTSLQVKFIIVLMVICNFLIANGVSLQGPFFPKEAENKGATPIIYSSIFAIYELVMLVTSFLFGNLVERFKPNRMSGVGLAVTGVSTAIFGLLTYFDSELYFVLSSFALRITESLGATAFATSSYSFIATCFPDRTATMFATMETFFGLGVITGPVLGGLLYDFGGFLLPFISTGIVMTLCGAAMITGPVERLFCRGKLAGEQVSAKNETNNNDERRNRDDNFNRALLPDNSDESTLFFESSTNNNNNNNNNELIVNDVRRNDESPNRSPAPLASNEITLYRFLSSPIILLDSFIIISAITLMGFNGATLEPFLRHSQITTDTLRISLMFVAIGASYAFTAIAWGKAADRFPALLLCFEIAGSTLTAIGLALIGPLPFLRDRLPAPNLWSIFGCLILFGVGTASKQVAAYTHALNHTIKWRKFPANQQTYGLISGMFFSCLSFGGFVGPIIGGALVQRASYPYATLVMFVLELFVLALLLVLQLCSRSFRVRDD